MSKNHPNDNIYSILGKLQALEPTAQEQHDATVKSIYESVEAQGSILKGLREVSSTEQRLAQQFSESQVNELTRDEYRRQTANHRNTPFVKKKIDAMKKMGYSEKQIDKVLKDMHPILAKEQNMGPGTGGMEEALSPEQSKRHDAKSKEAFIQICRSHGMSDEQIKRKLARWAKTPGMEHMKGMEEDYASMGTGFGTGAGVVGETAPPGMEKMVMKLKKEYPGHPEKAFATAWSIYNKKHGKAEESREACTECSMHEDPMGEPGGSVWEEGMEEAVHVGKYGTEYYGTKDFTGDDEDTAKAKSTEKKGRGRPTKASTGEKTSQERMPWGGKPPKVDANPTKKWPKEKTTVHKIAESMSTVGNRLLEGLNFKRMAEETHQSIDELMSELQRDISHYKTTGHCSEKLKDFLQVHSHSKKQMEEESAMEASAQGGIGHDLVTPAQRLAPTQSKPGIMGAVKDVAQGASNWLRGKPETGPTYEETDPLEEELNELAKLAGLKVADEGAGVMHFKKQQAEKAGKDSFKLGDKEFPVDECDMEEGNEFSGELTKARAQHKDSFEVDGKEYQVKEGQTEDNQKVSVEEPDEELSNKPDEEYMSMKASTMNPGEGDWGEKNNYDGPGDNKMKQQPNRPAKPVRSVKEAFATMEAKLAAEYESIKKVN